MKTADSTITAENLVKLAEAKAEEGDSIEALQNYSQAISLNPQYARAYGERGLLRANLGDKHGAREDYQQAAQLFLAQGSKANYEMVLGYLQSL
ncbi:MAG: tetratricopeptide repeat protein [Cyanophyceae cyanobacterium]